MRSWDFLEVNVRLNYLILRIWTVEFVSGVTLKRKCSIYGEIFNLNSSNLYLYTSQQNKQRSLVLEPMVMYRLILTSNNSTVNDSL